MRVLSIRSRVWLRKPLGEVFPFFSEPGNLELLTPKRLKFRILSRVPADLAAGAEIDCQLRIKGIPVRWRSEITKWEPPHLFIDEQSRGPYRLWIHEHRFKGAEGVTLAEDFVKYAVPGGLVADRLFVRRDLRRIFRFRREKLQAIFGSVPRADIPHGA